MDENEHRRWDVIFKWFALVGVLGSAWWTVCTYNEGRSKDSNSFIFQQQSQLYFDAARAAATIAIALDPAIENTNVIDPKTFQHERERIEQLFWGELVVVEDRRVELAMIAFRSCMMIAKGVDCKRPSTNQHSKPLDPEIVKRLSVPNLPNFSLELSACIRTALQEDREIHFGAIKEARTMCPYD